jgi:hypothetical protein
MEAIRAIIKIEIQTLRNKKIEEKIHKVVKREVENSRRYEESVKTTHSLLVMNRVLFIGFQTASLKPIQKPVVTVRSPGLALQLIY